jgi:type III pantothenate kinase
MLLALDVGNTNITAAVFDGRRLVHQFRVVTDAAASARRLANQLRAGTGKYASMICGAVCGSVVPGIDKSLLGAVKSAFGCRTRLVTPGAKLGIRLRVKHPGQVGADRILNALGAFERARGAAVVIDFGTATTFDCVSPRGDYLGGAILPGPNLAAGALHEHTAKLPLVPVRRPRRVVGKDTVECIQAGLYFGYLGMIERILRMTIAEMRREGCGGRIPVLATGGLCALFKDEMPARARIVPDLTLQGLRIAHGRLEA